MSSDAQPLNPNLPAINVPSIKELAKGYLQKAVAVLDHLGIQLKKGEDSELAALLQEVVTVDQPSVLAIAETVQYMGTFNQMVRDNVQDMNVSQRYDKITENFNSIREDSKTLVDQLADGKISTGEKVQQIWMKMWRGTPHARFEAIRDIYHAVSHDTKEQLDIEDRILDGYMDFRFALKDAETLALKVKEAQENVLQQAKDTFNTAKTAYDHSTGLAESERSRLQLARDEADRVVVEEDKKYQLLKDVSEDLKNGYNLGEVLVARLKQTHDLKERIYRRAVSFFTNNEHIFTIMDAVYTSTHGLHESTQTLEAMTEGIRLGMEDVATMHRDLDKAALRAGYGATFDVNAAKKLVDAIVAFQIEMVEDIAKYRKESAEIAKQNEAIVEDGKRRFFEVRAKYLAAPVQSP